MIKTLLRLFFVLAVLIATLLTFILTPTGLRVGAHLASKLLPGQLSYQKISGVIIGPITIDQLHYKNKTEVIDIGQLRINWQPADLFKKELHIQTLDIHNLQVITQKHMLKTQWNEQSIQQAINEFLQTIKDKIFPLHLVLDEAHFTQLAITNPEGQTNISDLLFHASLTSQKWDVQFLAHVEKPTPLDIQFHLNGMPSDYALQLSIKGDRTDWALSGNGDQQSLHFQTVKNVLLNGTLNATLYINWKSHLSWQAQLNGNNINLSMLDPQLTQLQSLRLNSSDDMGSHLLSNNALTIKTSSGQIDLTALHKNKWHIKGIFNAQKEEIKHAVIQIDGDFDHGEWHGTLHQLTLAFKNIRPWKLTKPTAIRATKDTLHLASLCLHSFAADNVCLQGNIDHQQLSGIASINITDFKWLHKWSQTIIPSGQIHAKLKISGTLKKPDIAGSVHLDHGNFIFPAINLTLHNISATIASDARKINFKAQAFSQKQPIHLDGAIDLSQPDFLATMKLETNNTLILNTDQYIAYVTSDLTAKIKNKDIFLTGSLTIPKALVHLNDFKETTKLPDNDIVYIGENVHPPKPFWLIHTDVTINIGNHVRLNAAGVNALMGGSVRIQQQPTRDTFGTGKIFTRTGTFSVYGQTLTIQPGSNLSFENSLLDDPTLNLKASKNIRSLNTSISNYAEGTLTVGVELHGNIKAPKINFFSNRGSLSQADILSYLLLGYGNDNDTPGNTDLILRALAAVNIKSQGILGKQNIAAQIQNGLGLNEMGVESDTTADGLGNPLNRETAFVVGKCLTRKICARYSIGLTDPMNVTPTNMFDLRYLFDKHWALQANTSQLGTGADVLYTFNRN